MRTGSLGRSLGAGTAAALALFAGARSASAQSDERCVPTAVADGDADAVSVLVEQLGDHGVSNLPQTGCPSVRTHIERRGKLFHIEIIDAYGRFSARKVRNLATAAAIVASWTRQEVSARAQAASARMPTKSSRAVPRAQRVGARRDSPMKATEEAPGPAKDLIASQPAEPEPMPAADSSPAVPAVTQAAAAPAPSLSPPAEETAASAGVRGGVAVAAESSVATDGSVWLGGALAGCVHWGRFCGGGVVHAATESSGTAQAHGLPRYDLAFLATLDLPWSWNRLAVIPGLGVGAGWTRTTVRSTNHGDLDVDGADLRTDAHLRLGFQLGAGIWLEGQVAFDAFLWSGRSVPPTAIDYDPGQPDGFLRMGLALRYGAW